MAVVRKKQDDSNLKALRELVTTGAGNRQCFDCDQKGPTYVNMTIGSFVCTRCSGVLRGLTPPHRIKSISMATFTQDEIDFLKAHGNEICAKTWLGLWDPKRVIHQDHRELMVDKYERKRYYLEPASPLKSLTNTTSLKQINAQNGNNNFVQTNINGKIETARPITNGYVGGHNQRNTANTFDNNFHKIQLTPPTSQRNTVNRQHKTASSTAIIRPQQHNGINQQQQHQNAFGLSKEMNGGTGYTSNGPLSDTNHSSSNSFVTDSDFVADFGTANIFDASTTNSNSIVSTNGYAKIQPIKKALELINVANVNSKQQLNGAASNSSGNIENFADFEHAPIYNSAGFQMSNKHINGMSAATNTNNLSHNISNDHANNNNNQVKTGTTPSEDRYAALKHLDEQLRESKAVADGTAAVGSSFTAAGMVDTFGYNANNANNNYTNNSSINPFQTHNAKNLYGQMPLNNCLPTNDTTASSTAAIYSYTNGLTMTGNETVAPNIFPGTASAAVGGPNGCGFGFGAIQQQIASTGGLGGLVGSGFNNPFTATGALNSNNPFL